MCAWLQSCSCRCHQVQAQKMHVTRRWNDALRRWRSCSGQRSGVPIPSWTSRLGTTFTRHANGLCAMRPSRYDCVPPSPPFFVLLLLGAGGFYPFQPRARLTRIDGSMPENQQVAGCSQCTKEQVMPSTGSVIVVLLTSCLSWMKRLEPCPSTRLWRRLMASWRTSHGTSLRKHSWSRRNR